METVELPQKLIAVFGTNPRPETLLDMSNETRKRYAKEVDALEAMDWEHGNPDDLDAFYEPNTFLSIVGYKYLIPKVFQFCQKWPEINKDLVEVMKVMPFLGDTDAFANNFLGEERWLLWLFLEETHKLTGDCIFEDFGSEATALQTKLISAEASIGCIAENR